MDASDPVSIAFMCKGMLSLIILLLPDGFYKAAETSLEAPAE